jgi:predicted nucleotidyltransferase
VGIPIRLPLPGLIEIHAEGYRQSRMTLADPPPFANIEATFKKASAALRDAGIPFMLGGSLASWARGGPAVTKDLDLMVRHEDAERALEALVAVGMRAEDPPEGWLVKAWDGDVMVDLIHHARGLEITDEVIERADTINVVAMPVRVMALEDVVSTKLLALDEHALDYGTLLSISRALREQIDWGEVRRRTDQSPYARAFFALLAELELIDAAEAARSPEPARQIRVVTE